MEISSATTGFVNAFGGIPYTISATPQELVEVSIFGSNEAGGTLAIKSMSGQSSYVINVAPFIYQYLSVVPLRGAGIEPILTDRVLGVFIGLKSGASTLYSPYARAYAGVKRVDKHRPMSDRFQRSVVVGEIDEVSTLVEDGRFKIRYKITFRSGGNAVVDSADLYASYQMVVAVVDTKFWAARYPDKKIDKIEVAFDNGTDFTIIGIFKFEDKKSDTVTLKWVNKYGAVDSYSFDNLHQKTFCVDNRKIYHNDEAHVIAGSAYTEFQISSRCEPPTVIEWLSEIIRSPRVWMDNGAEFEQVDVITNKIVSKRDELSFAELTLKKISQDKIQIM